MGSELHIPTPRASAGATGAARARAVGGGITGSVMVASLGAGVLTLPAGAFVAFGVAIGNGRWTTALVAAELFVAAAWMALAAVILHIRDRDSRIPAPVRLIALTATAGSFSSIFWAATLVHGVASVQLVPLSAVLAPIIGGVVAGAAMPRLTAGG